MGSSTIKYACFILMFPFILSSQGIISAGASIIFADERPVSSGFGLSYLHTIKYVALKAGSEFEPGAGFGLKYTNFGMLGLTSLTGKNLSFHSLLGLAYIGSTRENPPYYLVHKLTPIFNIGCLFAPNNSKRFLFSVEARFWKQMLDYGYRITFEYSMLSISISASYRFKHKTKKERVVS